MVLRDRSATLTRLKTNTYFPVVVREFYELSREIHYCGKLFESWGTDDYPHRSIFDSEEFQVDDEASEGHRNVAEAPETL